MLKDGGYLLLITPPTWTGGTNQLTDQGRINLLEKAVEQHNLIELDYLVNNAEEFKKIGSQFVISLIQAYKGYTGKTKFTDKEGNEFYVDLRGIGALPDSRKVSEEYLRVYIKMKPTGSRSEPIGRRPGAGAAPYSLGTSRQPCLASIVRRTFPTRNARRRGRPRYRSLSLRRQ